MKFKYTRTAANETMDATEAEVKSHYAGLGSLQALQLHAVREGKYSFSAFGMKYTCEAIPECETRAVDNAPIQAQNAVMLTGPGVHDEFIEPVNHPKHYGGKDNPYEAIKVIEAWELGFCLGNTVKYISRAGKKDQTRLIEDLKKAKWYLDREISNAEANLCYGLKVPGSPSLHTAVNADLAKL